MVAEDSPSQKLGLKPGMIPVQIGDNQILIGGDIVLEVQGITVSADVEKTCQIRERVRGLNRERSLDMKVLRDGKILNLYLD